MSGDGNENSGENVMPCVCDHSRAKTVTIDREKAEEHAISDDGDHAANAFVPMRCAEKEGRDENANPQLVSDGRELLQQITAEDELLDDAGDDAERDPDDDLENGLRGERDDRFLRVDEVNEAQQDADGGQHDHGDNPEDQRDAEVTGELFPAATAQAQDGADRRAAHAESPPGNQAEKAFPCDGDDVALDMAAAETAGPGLQSAESGDTDDDSDQDGGMPPRRDGSGSVGPGSKGRWCFGGVL